MINNKKLYFVDVKNGEDEEFGARLLCSMKLLYLYNKNYYWHKKRVQGSLRYSRSLKSTESYLKLLVEYYKFISKTIVSTKRFNSIELNPLAEKEMLKFVKEQLINNLIDKLIIEVKLVDL